MPQATAASAEIELNTGRIHIGYVVGTAMPKTWLCGAPVRRLVSGTPTVTCEECARLNAFYDPDDEIEKLEPEGGR